MQQNRVYVTGMGIVAATGIGVADNLHALEQGKPGIGYTSLLQTIHKNSLPVGEVRLTNEQLALQAGIQSAKPLTRTTLMGILALQEALHLSNTVPAAQRTGFINATTVGGMSEVENIYFDLIDPLKTAGTDYLGDALDCADCSSQIAKQFAINDWISTVSTACSSAANAILYGARLIKNGLLDVAICGGTDALTRFTLNGFNSLKNIDKQPCMPFDANRNGLNLGEGAAYLVLESEQALARSGNKPLAILSGYCNFNEAFHPTAPSPDGEGALQAMRRAIDNAGLTTADISYINAHGTATLNNDLSEGQAMKRLFGNTIPLFSSTKPFTGHTLGAAGAIEAVFSIISLQQQWVFPNLHFQTPMPELALQPVTTLKKNVAVEHVLSNSFGFGGNNASLVFSKYA